MLVQYPGLTPGGTLSPPCGKVQMALRFKRLDFVVHNLSLPSQVRRYNPRGRLPVLRIGDESIVDSTDILTELDRRWPAPPLAPAERQARARCKILEDWADECLYFYGVWLRFLDPANFSRMSTEVLSRLPRPARWLAPRIARREVRRRLRGQGVALKDAATVHRELEECLDAVGALLDDAPFLVGEQPTRADLAVAAVLDQLRLERLTPDASRSIGSRPELLHWLDRVHAQAPAAC